MPLSALMRPPLIMVLLLVPLLHATVSPMSPLDVRGTARCHSSCHDWDHDAPDGAEKATDPMVVLISSIQCRNVVDTEAGIPMDPESVSSLERSACSLLLPVARSVGQSGARLPDEQRGEAPPPADLGASDFGNVKASDEGRSIPDARFLEPGPDDLRPKRYGGFMERIRHGRLMLPPVVGSPAGQQQRSLRKRYGGFMSRVGQPWPEVREGLKRNEGFMRHLFGIFISSEREAQPGNNAGLSARGAP